MSGYCLIVLVGKRELGGIVMFRRKRSQEEQVTKIDEVAADLEAHPSKIEHILKALPAVFAEVSGRIPFAEPLFAAYYAVRDPKTDIKVKAVLAAALAYFIMPIDLIPDVIAGFGFTDDLAVLMIVLRRVHSAVTPEHYELARRRLKGDEQTS